MLKSVSRVFLRGLLAILPIVITVALLWWLGSTLETLLGAAVRWVLPRDDWYVPGMGLAIGLVAIFAIGLLFQTWMIRRVWSWIESLLDRIPLVRFVYPTVKQVLDYVSGSAAGEAEQVVVVTLAGDPPVEIVGLLTREHFDGVPDGIGGEDLVAVYLPMSYQMGGFTVMVPRSRTRVVDMSLEEGLRFALTAGLSTEKPER